MASLIRKLSTHGHVDDSANGIMASPEVAEVPSNSAHAAMATVMARILAGSGTETRRTVTEEEAQRETQIRTKGKKASKRHS